jgi:hypothetical protein
MRRTTGVLFAIVTVAASWSGVALAGPAPDPGSSAKGSTPLARFEGGWIDLSGGWGPASACMILPDRPVECFRTSAGMERRGSSLVANKATPQVNCSTPLRLRDGINQTGATLSVFARGIWVNLGTFGFDNKTSSYTVGACAVELALGTGGGGSHYARCLYAGCVENVMLPGWDNTISSVYLH